jgi:hypothetical protein
VTIEDAAHDLSNRRAIVYDEDASGHLDA